ncbi:hypothetical protein F5X98DRAFT_95619 [Xylaria grammica]|nr:hypothetical protein F5X98DRAFT_95619 [Xylaria grammica]
MKRAALRSPIPKTSTGIGRPPPSFLLLPLLLLLLYAAYYVIDQVHVLLLNCERLVPHLPTVDIVHRRYDRCQRRVDLHYCTCLPRAAR